MISQKKEGDHTVLPPGLTYSEAARRLGSHLGAREYVRFHTAQHANSQHVQRLAVEHTGTALSMAPVRRVVPLASAPASALRLVPVHHAASYRSRKSAARRLHNVIHRESPSGVVLNGALPRGQRLGGHVAHAVLAAARGDGRCVLSGAPLSDGDLEQIAALLAQFAQAPGQEGDPRAPPATVLVHTFVATRAGLRAFAPALVGPLAYTLRTLVISDNAIEALPPEIGNLVVLNSLDVSRNKLRHLPATLGACVNLRTLNASGNQLKGLPRTIVRCQSLSHVDLSQNRLRLPPPELSVLRSVSRMSLSGNPLLSLALATPQARVPLPTALRTVASDATIVPALTAAENELRVGMRIAHSGPVRVGQKAEAGGSIGVLDAHGREGGIGGHMGEPLSPPAVVSSAEVRPCHPVEVTPVPASSPPSTGIVDAHQDNGGSSSDTSDSGASLGYSGDETEQAAFKASHGQDTLVLSPRSASIRRERLNRRVDRRRRRRARARTLQCWVRHVNPDDKTDVFFHNTETGEATRVAPRGTRFHALAMQKADEERIRAEARQESEVKRMQQARHERREAAEAAVFESQGDQSLFEQMSGSARLPHLWEAFFDPSSRAPYYVHRETGEARWDCPSSVPDHEPAGAPNENGHPLAELLEPSTPVKTAEVPKRAEEDLQHEQPEASEVEAGQDDPTRENAIADEGLAEEASPAADADPPEMGTAVPVGDGHWTVRDAREAQLRAVLASFFESRAANSEADVTQFLSGREAGSEIELQYDERESDAVHSTHGGDSAISHDFANELSTRMMTAPRSSSREEARERLLSLDLAAASGDGDFGADYDVLAETIEARRPGFAARTVQQASSAVDITRGESRYPWIVLSVSHDVLVACASSAEAAPQEAGGNFDGMGAREDGWTWWNHRARETYGRGVRRAWADYADDTEDKRESRDERAQPSGLDAPVFVHTHTGCFALTIPRQFDRWGSAGMRFAGLTALDLSQCGIVSLPVSLGSLQLLETLNLDDNRLRELPTAPKLDGLVALRTLQLRRNELNALSSGVGGCTALVSLVCSSNPMLASLAPEIARCRDLRHIDLSHCNVRALPVEWADLTQIRSIRLAGNGHLESPPQTIAAKGTAAIRAWLAEAKGEARFGPPPISMEIATGVADTCPTTTAQRDSVAYRVVCALKDGDADSILLNWAGLTEVPPSLNDDDVARRAKTLSLVGNQLTTIPKWFRRLVVLETLNLSCNPLSDFPAGALNPRTTLEHLNLAHCSLESVPETVVTLRRLKTLNMTSNRIQVVPPSIEQLGKTLEHLDMSSNYLELLPEEICRLTALVSLRVSDNRLTCLPSGIGSMRALTVLRASSNRLSVLPVSFRDLLVLRDLHLSNNALSVIPQSLAAISAPVESIWLQNNSIVEIEEVFQHATSLKDLRLDGNPLRSPPLRVAAKGRATLLKYAKERSARFRQATGTFRRMGIPFHGPALRPRASGVYAGDPEHLTVRDLELFDQAVDRFLNADFFLHTKSIEDIAEGFLSLKDQRQSQHHLDKLAQIVNALLAAEEHGWVDERFLHSNIEKAYGRNKTSVPCFAVVPDVLFTTLRKRMRQRELQGFRDALFNVDEAEAKEAVRAYRGPYGRVGSFENTFFDGDDEDAPPVTKHALVIVRTLVTAEEARAERAERKLLLALTATMKDGMSEYLDSPEGATTLALAADAQRRELATRRKRVKTALSAQREMYSTRRTEHQIAELRTQRFLSGRPIETHRLTSRAQGDRLVRKARRRRKKAKARLRQLHRLDEEIARTQRKEVPILMQEIRVGMMAEQLKDELESAIDRLREEAAEEGRRRPWDGDDGMNYKAWLFRHRPGLLSRRDLARIRSLTAEGRAPDPSDTARHMTAFVMGNEGIGSATIEALIGIHGGSGKGELDAIEAAAGPLSARSEASEASGSSEPAIENPGLLTNDLQDVNSDSSSQHSLDSEDLGVLQAEDTVLEYGGAQAAIEGGSSGRRSTLSKALRSAQRQLRLHRRNATQARQRKAAVQGMRKAAK